MNKKIAIVFVISALMLQYVLLAYFNYRYVTQDLVWAEGKNYVWFLIVQLGFNEVVVFSVGFLIYFKDVIMKSKSVIITSIVLIVSILGLLIGGLYYGIEFEDFWDSSIVETYNNYQSIFYGMFAFAFMIFMISILRTRLLDYLPRLLVMLIFSAILVMYLYSSLYYGWFAELLSEPSRFARPLRYMIGVTLLQPLLISIYIVSALYVFKSFKRDEPDSDQSALNR